MKPDERFAELWTDYLEGELEEAGHQELRTLIAAHEPLRKQAADLYQVHRLLGFAGVSTAADSESFIQATLAQVPVSRSAFVEGVMQRIRRIEQPSIPSPDAAKGLISFRSAPGTAENPPRGWHRREWLAAAAALTVSTFWGVFWSARRLLPATFARVTHNAGAIVTQGGRSMAIRDVLPHGPLALIQGKLGLTYGAGVQLVIEAPAEFECRHSGLLLLHSGRIAAHVPPEGVGFTVETPRGQIVDRGTRFALDSSSHASTQVHVFEGKVDAHPHEGGAAARRLVTGEAIGLARELETLQLRDGAFVHPEELPSVVAGLRVGQYERWRAWRRTVQGDASLVLFAELDPDRLADGAAGEHMKTAGTRPVQGRWPGKSCLDFNQQGDAVKLDVGGQRSWPQLTLAAWVRLDRLGEPYQSLYHTDDWQRGRPGQLHWMITRTAKMRLALQGNVIQGVAPGKPVFADADSSVPVLPERGRWVHLAAVYDSAARTVRFFLNGILDNIVLHDVAHPAQLGSAQIGNWNQHDRKLSGRFDELVILGRAAPDEEVQAIHAAGNPYA